MDALMVCKTGCFQVFLSECLATALYSQTRLRIDFIYCVQLKDDFAREIETHEYTQEISDRKSSAGSAPQLSRMDTGRDRKRAGERTTSDIRHTVRLENCDVNMSAVLSVYSRNNHNASIHNNRNGVDLCYMIYGSVVYIEPLCGTSIHTITDIRLQYVYSEI